MRHDGVLEFRREISTICGSARRGRPPTHPASARNFFAMMSARPVNDDELGVASYTQAPRRGERPRARIAKPLPRERVVHEEGRKRR